MTYTPDQFADLAITAHDPDAAQKAADLLNGKLEPEDVTGNVQMVQHDEWVMIALNKVLDCYGVEALIPDGQMAPIGLYLNTGDTYSLTVVLDEDGEFHLTTWGDFLEAWEREQAEEGQPY